LEEIGLEEESNTDEKESLVTTTMTTSVSNNIPK
jgi:hypothetical protein